MLRTRVIPALLLRNGSLVKTIKFNKFQYIGDPCNTVRIFNELEVDELIILDISASRNNNEPNYRLIAEIASECFMPVAYGGGIRTLEMAKRIFDLGIEKVSINTKAIECPMFITELANHFGSQSIILSIDAKQRKWRADGVLVPGNGKCATADCITWAKEVEARGAGEILLTSVNREGTWQGFDLALVKCVADAVSIPVIAHGGAACVEDVGKAVKEAGASAVAIGSMVVFQKKGKGVLVNFPPQEKLAKILS